MKYTAVLMIVTLLSSTLYAKGIVSIECKVQGKVDREEVRLNAVTSYIDGLQLGELGTRTIIFAPAVDKITGKQIMTMSYDGVTFSHSFHGEDFADNFGVSEERSNQNQDRLKNYLVLRNLDANFAPSHNNAYIQLDAQDSQKGILYGVDLRGGGNQSSSSSETWFKYECSIEQ